MKVAVDRETGIFLNIKPDKEGFYYVSEDRKISISEHSKILQSFQLNLKTYYLQRLEQ